MPNNGISGTNDNKTTNYRIDKKPKFLVITNSVSPTPEQALSALYRDGNSSSVHYFIRKDGNQDQFNLEDNQSFTCGRSQFGKEESLNKTAITVMFINTGSETYTEEQKVKFKAYLANFKERNPHIDLKINLLSLGEVATQIKDVPEGHGKIFPRHEAPGKLFFWDELAVLGFGLFVSTTPEQKAEIWVSPDSSELEIKDLQTKLREYGYAIEASGVYDDATKAWVTRFNQRYVPDATQTIDASIWSKASQISLDNVLNYINAKTNAVTQSPNSPGNFFITQTASAPDQASAPVNAEELSVRALKLN